MCGIYVILNQTFIWDIVIPPMAISESSSSPLRASTTR